MKSLNMSDDQPCFFWGENYYNTYLLALKHIKTAKQNHLNRTFFMIDHQSF